MYRKTDLIAVNISRTASVLSFALKQRLVSIKTIFVFMRNRRSVIALDVISVIFLSNFTALFMLLDRICSFTKREHILYNCTNAVSLLLGMYFFQILTMKCLCHGCSKQHLQHMHSRIRTPYGVHIVNELAVRR